jgi:hypothetical protein
VHEALTDKIYEIASETVHRGVPQPNYLVWGSLIFAMNEINSMIENLPADDSKLGDTIDFLIKYQGIRWFFG